MIKSYDLCKMVAAAMKMILWILTFAVVFLTVSCDVNERNVTVKLWPDCEEPEYKVDCGKAKANDSNVVYAKAFAATDSLLYAFSTIGMPTIVIARVTGGDTDMHFNWTKLVSGNSLEDAITINTDYAEVKYKFGVAFTRLIEYNDVDNNADLKYENATYPNGSDYWIIRDLNLFNWNLSQSDTQKNTFIFNATSEHNDLNPHDVPENASLAGNWSISFSFTVRGDSGRDSYMPSLKYEANETQFDFVMSNFTPTFNKSRFALEAIVVSQSTNKDMQINTINSIDDEYSPGVFKIVNWLSNPSKEESSGFFQWKPVCYNSDSRSRLSATQVKSYDLMNVTQVENMTEFLNTSIIFALFGEKLHDEMSVIIKTTNISFGLSDDGYFLKTNYTVWTAAIGYGTPPIDTISITVIAIISAGLGIPVIVLIFGGVYTCIRKSKKRKQNGTINSDTIQ